MTLTGLIAQAYPSPEWAVFFEVSDTTGFGAKRRADAVALGIWPSRGNALIGFEFKEDRRDWLREKQNPEKAEAVASKCDSWFVVAGSDSIVKVEELPEPWGLLVANKDRTRLLTVKPAALFPGRDKETIQRTFVASMLRKITETTVPKAELRRLTDEAVKDAVDRTREGRDLAEAQKQIESNQRVFDAFKEATGIDIKYEWRGPKKIAAAVNLLMSGDSSRDQLEHMMKLMERTVEDTREIIKAWPQISVDVEA